MTRKLPRRGTLLIEAPLSTAPVPRIKDESEPWVQIARFIRQYRKENGDRYPYIEQAAAIVGLDVAYVRKHYRTTVEHCQDRPLEYVPIADRVK